MRPWMRVTIVLIAINTQRCTYGLGSDLCPDWAPLGKFNDFIGCMCRDQPLFSYLDGECKPSTCKAGSIPLGNMCACLNSHKTYNSETERCEYKDPTKWKIPPSPLPTEPVIVNTTTPPTRSTTTSVTTVLPTFELPTCEPDWTLYEGTGSCVRLFRDKFHWEKARDFCKDFDAHLVKVKSPYFDDFLTDYIRQTHNASLWIGLTRVVQNSTLSWTRWIGEDKQASFTNWADDTALDKIKKSCVAKDHHSGGEWIAINCNIYYGFICERPLAGIGGEPEVFFTGGLIFTMLAFISLIFAIIIIASCDIRPVRRFRRNLRRMRRAARKRTRYLRPGGYEGDEPDSDDDDDSDTSSSDTDDFKFGGSNASSGRQTRNIAVGTEITANVQDTQRASAYWGGSDVDRKSFAGSAVDSIAQSIARSYTGHANSESEQPPPRDDEQDVQSNVDPDPYPYHNPNSNPNPNVEPSIQP